MDSILQTRVVYSVRVIMKSFFFDCFQSFLLCDILLIIINMIDCTHQLIIQVVIVLCKILIFLHVKRRGLYIVFILDVTQRS